jgi:hypothetical protein
VLVSSNNKESGGKQPCDTNSNRNLKNKLLRDPITDKLTDETQGADPNHGNIQ